METKILKEKVASGGGRSSLFGGAEDTDIEVDPTMRDLRMLYLKLEQDWAEERSVYYIILPFIFFFTLRFLYYSSFLEETRRN